jgi:hypothetical protein
MSAGVFDGLSDSVSYLGKSTSLGSVSISFETVFFVSTSAQGSI